MKTCECGRSVATGVLTCPYCGHPFPAPVRVVVPADEFRADNPHLFLKDAATVKGSD